MYIKSNITQTGCFFKMRAFCSDALSHGDFFTEVSGHHIWYDHGKKRTQIIDWMYEAMPSKPLFFEFPCQGAKTVTILSIFSMFRHPFPSYVIVVMNFFEHITIIMMFLAFCNKIFDVLKWAHQMKQWNGRQNMQFFRCVNFYIIKRLIYWLNTYLLTTLSWKKRGFGVLG